MMISMLWQIAIDISQACIISIVVTGRSAEVFGLVAHAYQAEAVKDYILVI